MTNIHQIWDHRGYRTQKIFSWQWIKPGEKELTKLEEMEIHFVKPHLDIKQIPIDYLSMSTWGGSSEMHVILWKLHQLKSVSMRIRWAQLPLSWPKPRGLRELWLWTMASQWEVPGRHQNLNLLYKASLALRVERHNKDSIWSFPFIDQEVVMHLIQKMIYLRYGKIK